MFCVILSTKIPANDSDYIKTNMIKDIRKLRSKIAKHIIYNGFIPDDLWNNLIKLKENESIRRDRRKGKRRRIKM